MVFFFCVVSFAQAETTVSQLPLPPSFLLQTPVVPAAPVIPARLVHQLHSTKFDFQFVSVAQVVNLIYAEMLKEPFVIDPEVLTDNRNVSFRYETSKGDARAFIANFFDSLGIVIKQRGGVDFIAKKKVEEKMRTKKNYLSIAQNFVLSVTSQVYCSHC